MKETRPEFIPEEWKAVIEAGCYPYALDMPINKKVLIGDFIGKRCTEQVSDEMLISTLIEELNYLGYKVREENSLSEVLKEDEKKIFLQREIHTGYYHLVRQDKDGLWSHKYPGELPTCLDSTGYVIEIPESMSERPFDGWCFYLRKVS